MDPRDLTRHVSGDGRFALPRRYNLTEDLHLVFIIFFTTYAVQRSIIIFYGLLFAKVLNTLKRKREKISYLSHENISSLQYNIIINNYSYQKSHQVTYLLNSKKVKTFLI